MQKIHLFVLPKYQQENNSESTFPSQTHWNQSGAMMLDTLWIVSLSFPKCNTQRTVSGFGDYRCFREYTVIEGMARGMKRSWFFFSIDAFGVNSYFPLTEKNRLCHWRTMQAASIQAQTFFKMLFDPQDNSMTYLYEKKIGRENETN